MDVKFFEKEKEAKTFSNMQERLEQILAMRAQIEEEEAARQPSTAGDVRALSAEADDLRADLKTTLDALKQKEKEAAAQKKETDALRADLKTAIDALNKKGE